MEADSFHQLLITEFVNTLKQDLPEDFIENFISKWKSELANKTQNTLKLEESPFVRVSDDPDVIEPVITSNLLLSSLSKPSIRSPQFRFNLGPSFLYRGSKNSLYFSGGVLGLNFAP